MERERAEERACGQPGKGHGAKAFSLLDTCIYAFFVIAFLSPLIFTSPAGLYGALDTWQYFGPTQYYQDCSWYNGVPPLWCSLYFCGQPYAANPQTQVYYPPGFLRSFCVALTGPPTPFATMVSIRVSLILHLLWAGLGTLALARAHGLSLPARIVAALAATLSFRYLEATQALPAVAFFSAWLPWQLYCTNRFLRDPRTAPALFLTLAMTFLAGYPPGFVYMGIVVLSYGLALYFLAERPRTGLLTAMRGAAAPACALLLIFAGLFLPAQELASRSTRSGDTVRRDAVTDSFRIEEAPRTPLRALRQMALYVSVDKGAKPLSAGSIAFFLAMVGLICGPHRKTLSLVSASYVALDCAMGRPWPISTLIETAAPLEFLRPQTATQFVPLFLGMLAGIGVDVFAGLERGIKKPRVVATVLAAVATTAILIAYGHTDARYEYLRAWVPVYAMILGALSLFVSFRRSWVCWGLLILVGLEFLVWRSAAVPYPDFQFKYELPEAANTTIAKTNRRRVPQFLNGNFFLNEPATGGFDPLHLEETFRVIAPESIADDYARAIFPAQHAENIRWHTFLKRPFWLVPSYVNAPLPPRERVFPPTTTVFLGAGHVVSVPERAIHDVPEEALSRDTDLRDLPLTFAELGKGEGEVLQGQLEASIPAVESHSALLLCLEAEGKIEGSVALFCPSVPGYPFVSCRDFVLNNDRISVQLLLPEGLETVCSIRYVKDAVQDSITVDRSSFLTDRADQDDKIRIVEWTATRVRVQVAELVAPHLLLFTDSNYPGWRVYVDGKQDQILTANDAFKAVELQAGTHEVVFQFASWRPLLGTILCGAGALSLLFLWALSRSPRTGCLL